MNYQTLIDDTTTAWVTYICKADLWRASSSPYWKILRIEDNWNVKYPAKDWFPSDEFEFIADNRATYTYSYTWS